VPLDEGIPLERERQRWIPSKNSLFYRLALVKTVADKHRLIAYHSKHWWRAFWSLQHRRPRTT